MHSPMEQFEIKRLLHLNLFGIDASFTNSSTWMIIAVILATAVFVYHGALVCETPVTTRS